MCILRVSHKTEKFLLFLVSELSWLGFVSWFRRHKLLYLATTSSIPSFCLKKCKKYKGFSKFIKGKYFWCLFQFLYFKTICWPKLDEQVWLLRSRRSFRHQDRPIWPMSYFYVKKFKHKSNFFPFVNLKIICIFCIFSNKKRE